jgi:ribosomal protein L30E
MPENVDIVRKNLGSNKLLFGEREAIKAIKKGEAKIIFTASNIKEGLKEDLVRYKKIGDFEIKPLKLTNVQLGAICKKQYNISIVTLLK